MATPRLVPLTVADPVTARILAAHLGAEGVIWEIRDDVGSPYPVGPVELLVDQDSLELARELLTEMELAPAGQQAEEFEPSLDGQLSPEAAPGTPRRHTWIAVAVIVVLALVVVGRLLNSAL